MTNSSSTTQPPASAGDAPLLMYPLKPGDNCVVSCCPDQWAALSAWEIREHDLDRWLEARHGAKPEDFWSNDFISHRGRHYCEAVLKYIIMFNHEEIGGHAVMFMDQMIMHWPHYFPYSMKYRCNVDELFEPDQIKHYGRIFLEKVVEWCKMTYDDHRTYWDEILENPPMNEEYNAFVQAVRDHHTPQKLKDMHIVPHERPDQWPCDYFAEARSKTAVPVAQVIRERDSELQCGSCDGIRAVGEENAASQPQDEEIIKSATTETAQDFPSFNAGSRTSEMANNDDLDLDDKKFSDPNSKAPMSPQGKKDAGSGGLKVPGSFLHRRVKSESDSPEKKSAPSQMSLADWITAPGAERRAVSTESQSQLLITAAKTLKPNRLPAHGRGGAQQAGQYQYRQGTTAPVFTHPYGPQSIMMNNAAYLYHEDHNFGRHFPILPDHSTTFRQGADIYRTNPRRGSATYRADGRMFIPLLHPHSGPAISASPYTQRADQFAAPRRSSHGRHSDQLRGSPFNGSAMGSPHMAQFGQHGTFVGGPQAATVLSTPFGTVPQAVMMPYIQLAQGGQWPQSQEPLSQAGVQPQYPGVPRMTRPFVPHASQQPFESNHRYVLSSGPHPDTEQQIHVMGNSVAPSTPSMGGHGGRHAFSGTNSVPFSQHSNDNILKRHIGSRGAQPKSYLGDAPTDPNRNASVNSEISQRMSSSSHTPRHISTSENTVPFPSYLDDTIDYTLLTEGEQCTSTCIGPDAEDVVTLWFGDIPPNTYADQLKAFIEEKMPVVNIKTPITYDTKQNFGRGWTFVKFVSNRDTRIALEYFQGLGFNGGKLKVQVPERRTRQGLQRHSRRGSSISRYGQAQVVSESTTSTTGYQSSFSGGSTPGRFQGQVITNAARNTRGSSMSQAINAVRRNSAYTQQDARSDLPLGNVPEVVESAQSPTLTQQEFKEGVTALVEAPRKIEKRSKKKKKKGGKSRDGSSAPSDSNVSSNTEIAEPSHVAASISPFKGSAKYLKSSYSAIVSSTDADHLDRALALSVSTNLQPAAFDENSASSKASVIEEAPVMFEKNSATEDQTVENKADVIDAEDTQDDSNNAVLEIVPEVQIKTGTPSSIEKEYICDENEDADGMAEAADVSNTKSETTTTMSRQNDNVQPGQAAGKSSKQKGAAQTESFSIFATKNKVNKNTQKKKDKKARQAAARKASKQSTDPDETPQDSVRSESSQTVNKSKERSMSQYGISESSSMAGTPKTAREYPISAPSTPTPHAMLLTQETTPANVASSVAEEDDAVLTSEGSINPGAAQGKKPRHEKNKAKSNQTEQIHQPDAGQEGQGGIKTEGDETKAQIDNMSSTDASPADLKPERRRSSVLGGMYPSKPTDPIPKDTIDLTAQPSHPQSEPSETSSISVKKESSKASMTYAQAAKNNKNPATMTKIGLGLSERDVNVPR